MLPSLTGFNPSPSTCYPSLESDTAQDNLNTPTLWDRIFDHLVQPTTRPSLSVDTHGDNKVLKSTSHPYLLVDLIQYLGLEKKLSLTCVMRSPSEWHVCTKPLSLEAWENIESGLKLRDYAKSAFESFVQRQQIARFGFIKEIYTFLTDTILQENPRLLSYHEHLIADIDIGSTNLFNLRTHTIDLLSEFIKHYALKPYFSMHSQANPLYYIQIIFLAPAYTSTYPKILSKLKATNHQDTETYKEHLLSLLKRHYYKKYHEILREKLPTHHKNDITAKETYDYIRHFFVISTVNEGLKLDLRKIRQIVKQLNRMMVPPISDYVMLKNTVGLCELQGKRATQEDALVTSIEAVKHFPELSEDNSTLVLMNTFGTLQTQYGYRLNTGAVACFTVCWSTPNKVNIVTASLGDCTAHLFVLNQKTNTISSLTRLNELHQPDPINSPEEYRRVVEFCKTHHVRPPKKNRLACGLNPSRAFGDRYAEKYGLSHEPDISILEHKLFPNEIAYVIVACDGLTEAIPHDYQNNMVRILKLMQESSADVIAKELANMAIQSGSQDNVSVAVKKIDATPVSITVFDGHNGNLVAREISEHFYPELSRQIALALEVQNELKQAAIEKKQIPLFRLSFFKHDITQETEFSLPENNMAPIFSVSR